MVTSIQSLVGPNDADREHRNVAQAVAELGLGMRT
jgi:hypothetical protein